jgi:hypothetical protein
VVAGSEDDPSNAPPAGCLEHVVGGLDVVLEDGLEGALGRERAEVDDGVDTVEGGSTAARSRRSRRVQPGAGRMSRSFSSRSRPRARKDPISPAPPVTATIFELG